MTNFWEKLNKPYFILAPMADVTDSAFRQIVLSCGKPDILYTEFVSADGLCSEKGKLKLMPHLKFGENERPIVVQIFGSNPKNFYEATKLITRLCPVVNFSDTQSVMPETTEKSTTGFDGIDVNMGCPDRKILRQGGGAALILKPELAKEIIRETKRGAGSLPISVKTRLGFNKIVTEEWVSHLIEAKPDAIIIHGRTAKEMSKVPAHWDEIGKAAVLCRKAGIPIVGNGDVASCAEGLEKAEQYDLDGIMVGRGVFSNPWFFNPSVDPTTKTPEERIELLKKHIKLFTELWGPDKHFDVMKKFFKVYIHGWEGTKELRVKLMTAQNPDQVEEILSHIS